MRALVGGGGGGQGRGGCRREGGEPLGPLWGGGMSRRGGWDAGAGLRAALRPAGRPPVLPVPSQYSVILSEEEFFHVLEHYDKTLSAKIPYNDFLRAFLQ